MHDIDFFPSQEPIITPNMIRLPYIVFVHQLAVKNIDTIEDIRILLAITAADSDICLCYSS